MKNLMVIRFMEKLSSSEFKQFDKYVHSPLFNVHTDTTKLFDLLKKYYPKFPEKSIAKEKVYSQLYPNEPFHEKKIYDLGKYLQALLLKFLSLQEIMKEQAIWEPVFLIPAISNRDLDAYLPKFVRDAEKKLSAQAGRDEMYYLYHYHLGKFKSNIQLKKDSRSIGLSLGDISQQLNNSFLIAKLRLALTMVNRNTIIHEENVHTSVQEVLNLYDQLNSSDAKVAELYYCTLKMLLDSEASGYYQKFRDLISHSEDLLSKEALYEEYLYGVNYCSAQIKKGKQNYWEEVFSLYVEMLEKGLFFFYSSVSHINFKNLNNVSLRLNKLSWAESFIQEYQEKIDIKYRDSVVNYCLSRLYFEQKKYEQAQQVLNRVTFIDPFYRLNYDLLLIKIFYEQHTYDSLISRCEATLKYLQRDKSLSKNNKLAYANMVKFAKRLAMFRVKKKKNPDWILRDFEACNPLVDRNWLKAKIGEL